jgi:hypothetical protein
MKSNDVLTTALQHVILGSVTKQSSNGRIVVQMRMPLTGESLGTLPDWVARAYEDVSKKYSDVEPEVQEMSDLAIAFSNDKQEGQMFAKRAVKITSASLRGFKVTRTGKPDNPEVELQFKLYLSFAREFWAWAGEMSGDDVFMTFPAPKADEGPVAETAQLPLDDKLDGVDAGVATLDETPSLEEATGEREPTSIDSGPKSRKKSGPKELQAEHEKQAGRGRT